MEPVQIQCKLRIPHSALVTMVEYRQLGILGLLISVTVVRHRSAYYLPVSYVNRNADCLQSYRNDRRQSEMKRAYLSLAILDWS